MSLFGKIKELFEEERNENLRNNCSKCNKSLNFINRNNLNNTFLCTECYNKEKTKIERERKEIILKYINRYLSNKEELFYLSVPILSQDEEVLNEFLKKLDLEDTEVNYDIYSSKTEEIKDYIFLIIMHTSLVSPKAEKIKKILNDFVDDLDKLTLLLKRKGLAINCSELFLITLEEINKKLKKTKEKELEESYIKISKNLNSNLSKLNILRELFKLDIKETEEFKPILKHGKDNMLEENYNIISRDLINPLLNKFNMTEKITCNEFKRVLKEVLEEHELKKFEKNLGKKKIKLKDFNELNPYQFEKYVADLFRHLDYVVKETSLSGDQGADLIVSKNGIRKVVQVKKYNGKVPNSAIQQVVASKKYYKADEAIVVTTSSFTKSAIELAMSNRVALWESKKLRKKVDEVNKK